MLVPLVLIVVFIIVIYILINRKNEYYNQGTITQLQAKDVQDLNLTGDAWKYLYYPTGPYRKKFYRYPYNYYYNQPYYIGQYPYYRYMFNYPYYPNYPFW